MNYPDRPTQTHLKPDDLEGISASLRTIYTVADDGRFDDLLRDLDHACPASSSSNSSDTRDR